MIAALAHAPGTLDFYMRVVWRSWTVVGTTHVSLFGQCGLASHLGSIEYSAKRRFRQILNDWIRKVKALWPERIVWRDDTRLQSGSRSEWCGRKLP